MQCRRCGHPRDSHDEYGHCHTRIMTGWKDTEHRFTGEHPCDCTLYQGPVATKATPDDCPHELQVEGGHPDKCVHCGHLVGKKKSTT